MHMGTSDMAKAMGAKSLAEVANFYGCTPKHLRDVQKRNDPAFRAMVRGFVSQKVENIRDERLTQRLIQDVIDFTYKTKHTELEWLSAESSRIYADAELVLEKLRR